MQKIKIFFLLLALTGATSILAQSKHIALITKKSKVFEFKNGYGKKVDVQFVNYLDEKIDIEVIRKVAMSVMVKSKFKLKNRTSYVPLKLTLITSEDTGENNAIVEYLGKNSYGTESKSNSYFSFSKSGDVKYLLSK